MGGSGAGTLLRWKIDNMPQRFFYGFLTIAILFCVVATDSLLADVWMPAGVLGDICGRGSLIPLVFAVLILAGGWEMVRLMRSAGLRPHAGIGIVMSLVLLLSPWLCATCLVGTGLGDLDGMRWQLVWLALTLILTMTAQLRRGVTDNAIADVGATWMMVLYLGFLPSFAVWLRCYPGVPGFDAAWLVLAFLLITKASDIGAYIVGTLFGAHKLLPAVSPAKSVEGAVGGMAASILVALGLYKVLFLSIDFNLLAVEDVMSVGRMTSGIRAMEMWQVIVFGGLMSVSGQVGDLFESVLKRAARQKDSAAIIPGYGGVLDLIDSPVLAAPVAWFLMTVWWDVL